MKSSNLPWLLVALVGIAALIITEDPSGGNDKFVAATALDTSRLRLRALLPRKDAGDAGNAELFGAAPVTMRDAAPAQSPHPQDPEMDDLPSWNVIGKHLDGSAGWSVFVVCNDQTLIVRAGDVIADDYQVVSIVPPVMILRHAGRKTRINLDIGEAAK